MQCNEGNDGLMEVTPLWTEEIEGGCDIRSLSKLRSTDPTGSWVRVSLDCGAEGETWKSEEVWQLTKAGTLKNLHRMVVRTSDRRDQGVAVVPDQNESDQSVTSYRQCLSDGTSSDQKTSDHSVAKSVEYDGKQSATLTEGNLVITVDREPARDDPKLFLPVATGSYRGEKVFELHIDENGMEEPAATVSVMRLDPQTSMPQIVMTYFWGGAHCCTVTKIATIDSSGKWHVMDGSALDGDGYQFQDLDGDGGAELVSVDNSFLYAFASYASSNAPTRIIKLTGVELKDVTQDPRYQGFLRQQLREMESHLEKDNPEPNGYLGGWVAQKALLGELGEAWRTMLSSYDPKSDWELEECETGAPIESCPEGGKRKLDFPEALANHLVSHGYLTSDQRQRLELSPAAVSGSMQQCIGSGDTVKQLIVDSFVGGGGMESLLVDFVRLQDDFTVDSNDSSINKVVCAVTYEALLNKMIGTLAENRKMKVANRLSTFARRVGPVVTHRLHYSVQPTSKGGQSWVQLLP